MVNNEEFVIKVSDDISKFEHLINSYMCEMIEELKKANCTGMGGQRMLCEEIETEGEYFLNLLQF